VVGAVTGIVMWLCGLGSPLLWGTIAFLLNFVPILGPTVGVVLFLVMGLVTIDPLWAAFLPAALYLVIHPAFTGFGHFQRQDRAVDRLQQRKIVFLASRR
jgi:predicted PurR-regulated permease PerM